MPPPRFPSGSPVLQRFRRLGPVTMAVPAIVVDDVPDLTTLFIRAGTPIKKRVMPDGSPIPRDMSYAERSNLPLVVGDGVWTPSHTLVLVRPDRAHDIRLFWDQDNWTFCRWYVNLQRPSIRTSRGFDTADDVLDIVVWPDLTWAWKDEEEFTVAQEIGRIIPDEATAIRAEGEALIADIEAGRWPFNEDYPSWRPPVDWSIPQLPEDWNQDD